MNREEHAYNRPDLMGMVNTLILAKKAEAEQLYSLLQNTGYHITLAENAQELEIISELRQPFKLVLITDSFSELSSPGLVNYIKQHLKLDKIIYLSKSEDHEKERTLRSLGLIFLGSYQSFSVFAERIINHILKRPDQIDRNKVDNGRLLTGS
jgi:CheY-like chemotaxis protein